MTHGQFRIDELSDKQWRILFDNPPFNIVNPETVLEFQGLVDKIEASQTLQVVVFESANPEFFFGRYDIARAGDTPTAPGPTGLPTWIDMTVRLSQSPVVSIAKIRGRTRGGGAELAAAMDMRFASLEKAVFGQPEVGAGIVPGGGALDRLPPLLGRARALEVILGSLDYDAATAELYGWVNRALPDAELDAFVDLIARRIASFDRPALAAAKNFVNRHTLPDPKDLLAVQDLFLGPAATWPTVPGRRAKIYAKVGAVGPAEFERHMGRYLGEV